MARRTERLRYSPANASIGTRDRVEMTSEPGLVEARRSEPMSHHP